jgi:hypothetical protein
MQLCCVREAMLVAFLSVWLVLSYKIAIRGIPHTPDTAAGSINTLRA